MGLLAWRIEPWLLAINDVKLRTRSAREADVAAKLVYTWQEQADHFTIVQRRNFVRMSSFSDQTGDTTTSFSWYIGGGVTLTYTRAGRINPADQYVCTSDKVEIEDFVTGSGWQEQVWELQSKWTGVAGSYYEEAIDEEAPAE